MYTVTLLRPKCTMVVLAGALLLTAACSGPREASEPQVEPVELPASADVRLADYEDFDPAPYRDAPPPAAISVQHDVPASLMESRADEGILETVQGYRIQILSTQDKTAADKLWADAISWWQGEQEQEEPATTFPEELPVYIVFRNPYYRVRIGDFASRGAAQEALPTVSRRFTGAFVVPDTVTVMR
jgi:hypothetical protein